MRVVSLLPSATELLFAAGGGDLLVGRSHECDWPAAATRVPVLTSARIAHTAAVGADAHVDQAAIDAAVLRGKDVDKPRNLAKSVTVE